MLLNEAHHCASVLLTTLRRIHVPAYHAFRTNLGKDPTGTNIDDAIHAVKEAVWKDKEQARVKRLRALLAKKASQAAAKSAPAADATESRGWVKGGGSGS